MTRPMPTPAALGLRWWAPPGMRCTNLLVPGVPMLTRGDRCTNLLVPGVPVDLKFGEAIVLRGFAAVIVLKAGSSPPSFGVVRLAFPLTIMANSAGESVADLGERDFPLAGGFTTVGNLVGVGIFLGCENRALLGGVGSAFLTIFLTLALDVVRDCNGLF
jgi:hypothetical protein